MSKQSTPFPPQVIRRKSALNLKPFHAALVLVLVAACAILPPPGAPALGDVKFPLREIRAPNGMRILIEEDHSTSLVGVYTLIGAGSSSDPKGKEGLAHLIEHLTFRTKHDNKVSLGRRQELSGVSFVNAETWFDYTMYYSVGKKEFLPELLTLEAARLAAPLVGLDDTMVNVEREIVRNEMRERGETSLGPSMPVILKSIFPAEHPYSRSVGGTHESLDAVTLDDVKAFAQSNYRTDNATMLIIGDVDATKIDALLDKCFPRSLYVIPNTPPNWASRLPSAAPALLETPAGAITTSAGNVVTPELFISWSLPRGFGDDGALQQFVAASLQREVAQAARGDDDIVSINTSLVQGTMASFLVANVVLLTGKHPETSLEHVVDQLVNVWLSGTSGLSAENEARLKRYEFSRMRSSALISNLMSFQSIANRGHERVLAAHFAADPLLFSRRLKSLGAVSKGQVSEFAAQYLNRQRARTILVRPTSNAGANAAPRTHPSYAEPVIKVKYAADAFEQLQTPRFGDVQEQTLPNGLKIQVVARKGLPLVSMVLGMPQGIANSKPMAAAELGDLLSSARSHQYGYPGDYGILFSTSLSRDRYLWQFEGAAGNLPNMMAMLGEQVDSLHVESGLLERWKKEAGSYLKSVDELPQLRAKERRYAALMPEHAFGKTIGAKEKQEITEDDLDSWVASLTPRGAVVTIVGDVDAPKTLALAAQWLSGWKNTLVPPVLGEAPVGKRTVLVTGRPGATQTILNASCRSIGGGIKQVLLNKVLVEMKSSELHKKLRQEMGVTYGMHGFSEQWLGGSSLLEISGAIENDRLSASLKEVYRVFKEGIEEPAFDAARWTVGRREVFQDSNLQSAALILNGGTLAHMSPLEIDGWGVALGQMSPPEAQASWARCQETLVLSLTGDETVIGAALQAAGTP
jgi:zinc protease